jgi:primosomal protein N''
MSKKLWFIFEDDHHIGPFETEQMIEKISRGELLESHPIWSEGLAVWTKAVEVDVFSDYFLPPGLPPLVEIEEDLDGPPDLPPLPSSNQIDAGDDEPPPLPPLPHDDEDGEDDEELHQPSPSKSEATLKDFSLMDRAEQKKSWPVWILGAGLLLVVLGVQSWLYFGAQKKLPVFHELRPADAQLFSDFLLRDSDEDVFRLALTRDARAIIMASTLEGSWQVFLRLESIEQRLLSERKVILESRAWLNHHRAHFRDIEVIEGLGFVAGEYKVEVIAHHPIDKNLVVLKEFEHAFIRGTLVEFEAELDEMNRIKREKELAHVRERFETYQTLGMLIERIFTLYKETLNQIRDPNLIDRFEARYAQEVGPLLQGLIIESHQKMTQLKEQGQVEESQSYSLLVEFGKSVGVMVSDMVTTTKRARQFNRAGRDRLERLFESRQKTLQSDLKIRLKQLEELVGE